ncbi:holo-ACP synthase [Candidatus Pelagibacter sp.]|nr:holo-ACP synthase [Candidatus Pelagibacter sp.]
MKTIGVGVDIVENKRIQELIKNKKFISRIFSKSEIEKSKKIKNKINYFAKRFAAKESLSKAIGTGFRKGLNFKDISIRNDKYGKPLYKLNNNVKKLIYSKFKVKKIKISLSLADEKKYSIAFSVIHK